MSPALRPGSPEPADHDAVEQLLRFVPELAFLPELAPCVPSPRRDETALRPDAIDVDDAFVQRLAQGLRTLQERAQREQNGGLLFLTRTLVHFLCEEPVPAKEHPLIVALYLRSEARAGRLDDTPAALSRAMDGF